MTFSPGYLIEYQVTLKYCIIITDFVCTIVFFILVLYVYVHNISVNLHFADTLMRSSLMKPTCHSILFYHFSITSFLTLTILANLTILFIVLLILTLPQLFFLTLNLGFLSCRVILLSQHKVIHMQVLS